MEWEGINFLRELTYQYLRMSYPALAEIKGDLLSTETSLNREDSFIKNYKSSKRAALTGREPIFLIWKNFHTENLA